MAVTRINSTSLTGGSTSASAYTIAVGNLLVGDLVVVNVNSNGTHATNGIGIDDPAVLFFTNLLSERQQNAGGTRWQQTAYLYINFDWNFSVQITPYAGNTQSSASVDAFRGTTGLVSRAVQVVGGGLTASASTPALLSAPPAGDLVMSMVTVSPGSTATNQPSPYLLGSGTTTNVVTQNGYVLSADGTSTYGGSWNWGTSNTSALQTVSFAAAVSTPAPSLFMTQSPRRS